MKEIRMDYETYEIECEQMFDRGYEEGQEAVFRILKNWKYWIDMINDDKNLISKGSREIYGKIKEIIEQIQGEKS